jgi:hypothetical protein
MHPVFRKLAYKGQARIHVLDAPESFFPALAAFGPETTVLTRLPKSGALVFVLKFARLRKQVDEFAARLSKAPEGDPIVWIAYPKGSSKKYQCDFNRDNGWDKMGEAGFEPVSQVAIDEDWSALRFRRAAFIKTMTRRFALTAEGQRKAGLA